MISRTFLLVLLLQHGILEYHLLAQEVEPPAALSSSGDILGMSATVQLQLVIWITTLTGFIYTIYRENRNRKWDLEDRRAARRQAIKRSRRLEKTMGNIDTRLEENTQMTAAASSTAEDAATKLDEILKRFTEENVDGG
jgi:hypothetical protein